MVKNTNNSNIKTESKKPSPKKVEPTVKKVGKQKQSSSDHPQNSSVVVTASEKVSSLTSISTKVDMAGRRVSTRSKKPGNERENNSRNYFLVLFSWFYNNFYSAKLVLQQEFMFYTKKNNLDSLEGIL